MPKVVLLLKFSQNLIGIVILFVFIGQCDEFFNVREFFIQCSYILLFDFRFGVKIRR